MLCTNLASCMQDSVRSHPSPPPPPPSVIRQSSCGSWPHHVDDVYSFSSSCCSRERHSSLRCAAAISARFCRSCS